MSEAALLRLYTEEGNTEAFATLVTRYQQMVLATCRRILHHNSDIDDAVQETFLRLIQKSPEPRNNIGGWLYRCAANVSIDINRRRATRQRHEAAAVRNERLDDPQRMLAELREHLDAAIARLDPRETDLLVQRYFVGKPQVELAAQLGVSPATISARLEKAVDSLRGQLQAMGCALAAGLATAALANLLEAETASAAVPAALTANLMRIGLGTVPAGAAIGIGAILLNWSLRAVAGVAILAAIVLSIWAAVRHFIPPASPLAVVAASDSSQQVDPAPQSPALAVGPDHASQGAAAPNWQATQPSTSRAVLSGRVLDEAGNPIANATVSIYDGPARAGQAKTNDQGSYSFRSITRAGEFRVGVEVGGFVPINPNASNDPGVQLTLDSRARRDMVLQRGVSLLVMVAEGNGKPIPKASVDVNPLGGDARLMGLNRKATDALGQAHYTVPGNTAGYLVDAIIPGFAPAKSIVKFENGNMAQEVDLTLSPGVSVKGVAFYSDGKPASGDRIFAAPDWWVPPFLDNIRPIDAVGNFTLTDVVPGQYTLQLLSGGQGRGIGTFSLPPATQPWRINLPFPSPSDQALMGRVRFIGGNPVSVQVDAVGLGGDPNFYHAAIQQNRPARSGSRIPSDEAEFTINGFPPGFYRITFSGLNIEPKVIERFQFPGDLPIIDLHVIGQPHLAGVVTDAATGEPIPHFAVRIRKLATLGNGPNYEQDNHWTQVSDPEGHFSVRLVGPGKYQAQISLDGYAWLWSPEVSVEKGTVESELKVTPGGSLNGVVLDPAGKPLTGAKVIPLSEAQADESRLGDHFDGDAGAAMTDAQGQFTLAHLTAGLETLKIVATDFAPLTVSNLPVVEGQTTQAGSITLHVGGTVEGTFYDNQGNPMAGQTIEFDDMYEFASLAYERIARVATVTSDTNGHFRVEHLPDTTLYATVPLMGFASRQGVQRRAVHPIDGKITRLDFGGATPLTGRLVADGNPVANRRIIISVGQRDGPVSIMGATDATGRFTFYGIPPGRYSLYCEPAASRFQWLDLVEFKASDRALDLGDINAGAGDLVVSLSADDPVVLNDVNFVQISAGKKSQQILGIVAKAIQDNTSAGIWRAAGVPAGPIRIMLGTGALSPVTYWMWFDRKPGDPAAPVEIHLPRATATLTISMVPGSIQGARIQREDGAVGFVVRATPDWTGTFQLPPGTYRVLNVGPADLFRTDIPPIILKDGESKTVTLAIPQNADQLKRQTIVQVWSADGVLVSDVTTKIQSADGKSVTFSSGWGPGEIFYLAPGQYNVISESSGQVAVKQIDISNSSVTEQSVPTRPINVFLK